MIQSCQTQNLRLGDTAPDFIGNTTEGKISFHEWIGNSWCVLFSHPKDFTPVCTTELGYVAKIKPEFEKRGVKVIGLSIGTVDSHKSWIPDINSTQTTQINFPIIGDENHEIAQLYGMIHPNASETTTVRTVFIIDPNKKIRLTLCYPASTGRNFEEILRVIDSMQLTDQCSVATPANWKWGDECVILPSITDPATLKQKFPGGYRELTSYLRMTPQPKTEDGDQREPSKTKSEQTKSRNGCCH
jgi:alkyl hydroperoxide reductase subunit AhpC